MTRISILSAAMAAAISLAVSAAAQAPPADAVKAATALVELQTPTTASTAALERQLKEMREGAAIRAVLSANPRFKMEAAKNQPGFNAAMARIGVMQADAIGPILREMQPATRRIAIDTYAKAFTAAELEAIATFYRTPAGTKLLRQQAQISQTINRSVQQQYGPRLQAAEKTIGPKIQAELQKLFPPEAGAQAK
jgi:hypothetical protein